MYGDKPEDLLYYLTLYNENYVMPERPEALTDEEIVRGLYRFRRAPEGASGGDGRAPLRAAILSGGSIMQQALRAQELLAERGVAAEVWSALSYQLLRNEALEIDRWNHLHPDEEPRTPLVTELLREPAEQGPIIAVSDFITAWPDMIARWVPGTYEVLGTDGFGRSDTREALRRHFEVDAGHVVVAVLHALAAEGQVKASAVGQALKRYDIDPEAIDPRLA
jgi:pyruvate dehydrogenase E1 component